jgi:ABC-2 type transport system ATP-binding protein
MKKSADSSKRHLQERAAGEGRVADAITIETAGLGKQYKDVAALDGLNMSVPRGAVYGLLGRSGAGKTTAIKILMGLVRPTSGRASVFGKPADQPAASVSIRQRTGYVDDSRDLYDSMTVAEIIGFTARFFPKWRSDRARQYVRSFDLPESRHVKALSRGARTKLALLLAFCRTPELLIFDEVTSGLDPAAAEEVLQSLMGYVASEGATVFFSSHQISEIEQIADHVAIIDAGRTIIAGTLDDLRDAHVRIELVFDSEAPAAQFHSKAVVRVERQGRVLSVLASSGAEGIIAEARTLGSVSAEVRRLTLKEIFLELVSGKS